MYKGVKRSTWGLELEKFSNMNIKYAYLWCQPVSMMLLETYIFIKHFVWTIEIICCSLYIKLPCRMSTAPYLWLPDVSSLFSLHFQDVKSTTVAFLLLRIPTLRIKTLSKKEVFEANLKTECDLWYLIVKEMWAGKKMADDHKVEIWEFLTK